MYTQKNDLAFLKSCLVKIIITAREENVKEIIKYLPTNFAFE